MPPPDKDINDLHPDLKLLALDFLNRCADADIDLRITETWRDPVREDELHAQGITKATGATCKHCFVLNGRPASKAFDFAIYNDAGHYIADGTDPLYTQAGEIGEGIGLRWGGHFIHAPPDYDHFEIA